MSDTQAAADADWIDRAMALAAAAESGGEVPIGAVLVTGSVVVEAENRKERDTDPTAHAEILVLREAGRRLATWRVGGTLYVTKEPCAMCAGAIVAARVERLVFGCPDPKAGAAGSVIDVFASAAVNHRVAVTSGVLADSTGAQLRAFFGRKRGPAEQTSQGPDAETVL
jgi:tRNA(adenine34) deaminase